MPCLRSQKLFLLSLSSGLQTTNKNWESAAIISVSCLVFSQAFLKQKNFLGMKSEENLPVRTCSSSPLAISVLAGSAVMLCFFYVCKIMDWSKCVRVGLALWTNGTTGSSQSTPVRVFNTVQAKVSSKSSNKIQINTYRRDCVVTVILVSFQPFQRAAVRDGDLLKAGDCCSSSRCCLEQLGRGFFVNTQSRIAHNAEWCHWKCICCWQALNHFL